MAGPVSNSGHPYQTADLRVNSTMHRDAKALQWARGLAPLMLERQPQLAHRHVHRWLGGRSEFVKA